MYERKITHQYSTILLQTALLFYNKRMRELEQLRKKSGGEWKSHTHNPKPESKKVKGTHTNIQTHEFINEKMGGILFPFRKRRMRAY